MSVTDAPVGENVCCPLSLRTIGVREGSKAAERDNGQPAANDEQGEP